MLTIVESITVVDLKAGGDDEYVVGRCCAFTELVVSLASIISKDSKDMPRLR